METEGQNFLRKLNSPGYLTTALLVKYVDNYLTQSIDGQPEGTVSSIETVYPLERLWDLPTTTSTIYSMVIFVKGLDRISE